MDSTRPPEIVLEQAASCRDGTAARAELGAALALSPAPTTGWKVVARIVREPAKPGRIAIDAQVADANGLSVAHRVMSTDGAECAGLAKAVGVWASLVLDAEVERVKHPPLEPTALDPALAPAAARATSLWPERVTDPEKGGPEADTFLKHGADHMTIEVGAESFLMGGTGGGAVLGPALYGVFEVGHAIFLRPTLMVGHSVWGATPAVAAETFLAVRLDGCARLPGFYRERRGLQLDLCGGLEGGASDVDPGVVAATSATKLPFLAIGPSIGLRGELGNRVSATVRAVTEVSLVRNEVTLTSGTVVDPSLFIGRAEVGLSWALR